MVKSAAADPPLPDELLDDIFIRLEEPADLIRVLATCTSFHRIITAQSFLRRLRSLRRPPVLGLLAQASGDDLKLHPVERPHQSSLAAPAVRITFSFLPNPDHWTICDARNARILLARDDYGIPYFDGLSGFPDLLVCDPLHRRYVQLPPFPDNLTADLVNIKFRGMEFFLDPSSNHDESEQEDCMQFKAIGGTLLPFEMAIFQFSSVTGKWQRFTYHPSMPLTHPGGYNNRLLYHSYGHICLYTDDRPLIFDIREMELRLPDSDFDLPIYELPNDVQEEDLAFVDAAEGRLGLFVIVDGMLELYTASLENNSDGSKNWQHDKTIPLPEVGDCTWEVAGRGEAYIILTAIQNQDFSGVRQFFIFDLLTLRIERVYESEQFFGHAVVYANFPPPLSLPSV